MAWGIKEVRDGAGERVLALRSAVRMLRSPKKILSIPYTEWKRRGFSKGTLHYMKKNAEGDQPFTLNKHVMTRLDQWDQSVDQRGSTVDGMD